MDLLIRKIDAPNISGHAADKLDAFKGLRQLFQSLRRFDRLLLPAKIIEVLGLKTCPKSFRQVTRRINFASS
jgi:hypothetical protein